LNGTVSVSATTFRQIAERPASDAPTDGSGRFLQLSGQEGIGKRNQFGRFAVSI